MAVQVATEMTTAAASVTRATSMEAIEVEVRVEGLDAEVVVAVVGLYWIPWVFVLKNIIRPRQKWCMFFVNCTFSHRFAGSMIHYAWSIDWTQMQKKGFGFE